MCERTVRQVLAIFGLLCLWVSPGWAQLVIQTPLTLGEKQKLDGFIRGREVRGINSYGPELDSIGPIEHFIFRKAVLLGGLNAVFEDIIVPNSARARQEVHSGRVVSSGSAQWHQYYVANPADVYESNAVIPPRTYEKGLYTTREKTRALKIACADDLRSLTAASSSSWVVDWATLERLPLREVFSVPTRVLQFRMVEGGRADFTLQDFAASSDLGVDEQGIRLYPVPGVKIALDGSRHFLVSKLNPNGKAVFEALQKGLKIMQQNGDINRILHETGFVNAKVKDWLVLNK